MLSAFETSYLDFSYESSVLVGVLRGRMGGMSIRESQRLGPLKRVVDIENHLRPPLTRWMLVTVRRSDYLSVVMRKETRDWFVEPVESLQVKGIMVTCR